MGDEQTTVPQKKKRYFSIVVLSLLIFTLYIGLGIGYYCGYHTLTQLAATVKKESIARQQTETSLINQISTFNTQISTIETTLKNQAASLKNINQNDVSSLNIQTAYDLTVLANNELSVSNNVNGALILLNSAQSLLKAADNAKVSVMMTAIDKNITDLKQAPTAKVITTYLALTELSKTIRQLPFPTDIIQPNTDHNTAQNVSSPTTPNNHSSSVWQTWWEAAKNSLQKIVIIQHNPSTILPIALPTQKAALFQTIDAALLQTKWAILNQNQPIYQASLEQTKALINNYFRVDAKNTTLTLEKIAELEKMSVVPPTIDLSNTLQLFNAYLMHQ